MMNIFTAFNEEFVLPTKVMLKSLIENQTDFLNIYVFYSSLSQESINSIRRFEESGKASFCFMKIDDSFLDEISIREQFSKETYYRLFAHRIFPEEVDRVLWLDGDMIINGPLSAFYNQEFKGKLFVAVENHNEKLNEQKKTILKMPLDQKYANTGVMLFNLKEMRDQLIDREIIQYLIENQDILSLADQDVFNGFLFQYLQVVEQNHWYNYFHSRVTNENKAGIYSKVRIIHYCGPNKPWKENYSLPAADLWWEYALKTSPEYLKLFFETHCSKGELKNTQGELKNTQGKLKITQGELTHKCEELNAIKQSVSFRIGRVITWLPRKLRVIVRCL